MIVGTWKIIAIDHDSYTEEDVAGTGGSDDDNDDDDDEAEVEFLEHAADMVVPNIETKLVKIDLE